MRFKSPSFRLSKRGKVILWSGIALLAVFVGYVFTRAPLDQLKTLQAAGIELRAQRRTLQAKEQEIKLLENLKREYQELQNRLKLTGKVKEYSDGEVLNLLEELKNLVIQTNNRIVSMNPRSLGPSEVDLSSEITQNLRKFLVELTIRGRYSTLQDFFSRLSAFERLLTVEKVRIELKNPPELEMNLLLVFYMFAQQRGE